MDASVHAIVLLGILLAGALLLARLGGRVRSSSDLGKAFLRAILTSIGACAVLLLFVPFCRCGAGNNPKAQLWIPAVTAGICAAAIPNRRNSLLVAGALVIAGVTLGYHFHSLVLNPARCAYTGETGALISNSCNRPARAVGAWHTWVTGIYALRPQ
jgi:hypothetical protein